MRTFILIIGIMAITIFAIKAQNSILTNAEIKSIEGQWHTEWEGGEATMLLNEYKGKILGYYAYQKGTLVIEPSKENGLIVFSGTWTQDNGKGWYRFEFNQQNQAFTGTWGTDDTDTVQNYWNGTKLPEQTAKDNKNDLLSMKYMPDIYGITYDESIDCWHKLKIQNGNSYIYQTTFTSWVGFGHTTQIKVVDGIVIQRIYRAFNQSNNKIRQTDFYVENVNQIGSHKKGAAPITIDELYSTSKPFIEVDETENQILFITYPNGLLKYCGHVPLNCADDCYEGSEITGFIWLK